MKSKKRKAPVKPVTEKRDKTNRVSLNSKYWIIGILLITFIVYLPGFDNEITNWDDQAYISESPYVKDFSFNNTYRLFSEYYIGNYHPFSLLVYNIEYQVSGNDSTLYFIVNLILHLLNTFLVFLLMRLLIKNYRVASIVALLFGINPMHVESVAWLSELKDVLYSSFYLSSLIVYVRYIDERKAKFLVLSLFLFIISLLSKGQAVTLSLSIIAIDYLKSRNLLDRKVIIEKLPYLILSVLFGIIAIHAQKTGQAVAVARADNFFLQLVYAAYAYSQYVFKLLIPVNLSAIYPYPVNANGIMPVWMYLYIVPFALVVWLFFYSIKNNRIIAFGILFYTLNIFLLLQIIPVGKAIMADRYSYIPSIGLFFVVAVVLDKWLSRQSTIKRTVSYMFGVYVIILSISTWNRCDVWDNSLSLWDDVLKKYPELPQAAYNRAIFREQMGDYKGAAEDYNITINNDPDNAEAYNNRANARASYGDYKGAVEDLTRAISLRDNYVEAFYNRGIARINLKNYKDAIADFDTAIKMNPEHIGALNNRGNARKEYGDIDGAIKDYNRVIELMPDKAGTYNNRGNTYLSIKDYKKAISDFTKAIKLNPAKEDSYYNRGNAYIYLTEYDSAITDLTKAISINPKIYIAYNNRGNARASSGDLEGAISDYDQVITLNPSHISAYFNRAFIKTKVGDYEGALSDLNLTIKLNPNYVTAYYLRGVVKISLSLDGCDDLIKSYQMGYTEAEKDIKKYCK